MSPTGNDETNAIGAASLCSGKAQLAAKARNELFATRNALFTFSTRARARSPDGGRYRFHYTRGQPCANGSRKRKCIEYNAYSDAWRE